MEGTSATHVTIKCRTCGHDSSQGNYIVKSAKWQAIQVCSRCRQPLGGSDG